MIFMNFFQNKFEKIISVSLFVLMFFIFFYITKNTPFQSDDYFFYLLGLDFNNHLIQYMNWSGRVIADYFSPLMLYFKSHVIAAFIQASAASISVMLIYKIGMLNVGNYSQDIKHRFVSKIAFGIILFTIFFNFHPTLGHGVLWCVGASNYLITTCISLCFIYLLFNQNNYSSLLNFASCVFFGFIAGICFEYISVFLTLLFIFYFFNCKVLSKKRLFVIGLFLALGCAILFFCPGNYVRLHSGGNEEFLNRTTIEKIVYFYSIEFSFVLYKLKYIVIINLLLMVLSYCCNKKIDTLSAVFFVISIVIILTLFASPTVAERVLIIPFVIFMLSISRLLFTIKISRLKLPTYLHTHTYDFLAGIILIICVFSFVVHYVCVAESVRATFYQQFYRDRLVKMNLPEVVIPKFFWHKSYKDGDLICLAFDPLNYAKYMNVDSVIQEKEINFDYSALIIGSHSDAFSKDGEKISVYAKRHRWFNKSTLIIGINDSEKLTFTDYNSLILADKDGNTNAYYVDNRNFYHDKNIAKMYIGTTKFFSKQCITNVILNNTRFILTNEVCL